MKISFFEEYPTRENLEKLKSITFNTKLYLATYSLREFEIIKKQIKNKKVELIYWPLLTKREGYWISPFSKRSALLRIFNQLRNKEISIMLDLELPTTRNPWLYLTQFFNFFRNKNLIKQFLKEHPETYTAEYYPQGNLQEFCLTLLGVHYSPKKYKNNVIKMLYHSFHNFNQEFLINALTTGKKKYGSNFLIGYGCIGIGVMGNEPQLSIAQLKQDLEVAKECDIEEIIIFRLGGITKEYAAVLKSFT